MMPVPKAWVPSIRRLLAGQLDRLREFLSGWANCLRDRLAGAAGETVTSVLRALLDDPSNADTDSTPTRRYPEWGTPSWRDPYGVPREVQPSWRDGDENGWEDEPEEFVPVPAEEAPNKNGSRWRPTLAAALQA